MTQLNFIVNSIPRDLSEFTFFLVVGFTAGSMGLIWHYYFNLQKFINLNKTFKNTCTNNYIEIMHSTGKSNFSLPCSFTNSTTAINPVIFFPFLSSNLVTQPTVPPVAKRSSTIA